MTPNPQIRASAIAFDFCYTFHQEVDADVIGTNATYQDKRSQDINIIDSHVEGSISQSQGLNATELAGLIEKELKSLSTQLAQTFNLEILAKINHLTEAQKVLDSGDLDSAQKLLED
ncbi:MAG: hypothetical protein R2880_15750 [Deinococcales bacterium]